MSVATEQMICQEHLWTVVYVHDDSGRGSTNGRLPFELNSTSIRKPDGPTPEAERLAAALNMDDLKGATERCDTLERKFDSKDGSSVLITWVSTTSQGYFVQCWSTHGRTEI